MVVIGEVLVVIGGGLVVIVEILIVIGGVLVVIGTFLNNKLNFFDIHIEDYLAYQCSPKELGKIMDSH